MQYSFLVITIFQNFHRIARFIILPPTGPPGQPEAAQQSLQVRAGHGHGDRETVYFVFPSLDLLNRIDNILETLG